MARKAGIPTKTASAIPAVETAQAAIKVKATASKAATRKGTKVISGHYPESAYKQFKVAATMAGMSLQDALATALNLYLEDQNMPPVFPINKPKD
jgi:hypothetical protein